MLLVVALIAAALTYFALQSSVAKAVAEAQATQSVVARAENELVGYTSYTTFLSAGKQSLSGQMKLLAAMVTREESATQIVDRNFVAGITSKATVAIWHTTEYSFGYNLQPDQYDIIAAPTGIEIRVKKPALVATPAVSNLRHKVLSDGAFVDSKEALLKLQAEAAAGAKARGDAMSASPEIVALCEKKLIEFVYAFLSRQPGVKLVPRISVAYL